MRSVNQQRHARVHGSHHRLRAHGVHLNQDTNFLGLVYDSPESFHFLGGRPGFGSKSNLAGKLDSHRRDTSHLGTSFVGSAG
jgi:hypothetical protein